MESFLHALNAFGPTLEQQGSMLIVPLPTWKTETCSEVGFTVWCQQVPMNTCSGDLHWGGGGNGERALPYMINKSRKNLGSSHTFTSSDQGHYCWEIQTK